LFFSRYFNYTALMIGQGAGKKKPPYFTVERRFVVEN